MAAEEVFAWLVWVLPLIACLFVPVVAKIGAKARNYYVIVVSAVTAALAFALVPGVFSGDGHAVISTISWLPGIEAGVTIEPLSVLFTCLVAFFGLIIAIYSWGYMKGEEGLTRYYFLILLFIGSMIGLVISDNLLQMFIFWEMVGLCSYALISFWFKKPESVHAGNKVFIMTRIGDISLLAAIGILYMTFGTFSFQTIISSMQTSAAAGTLNLGLMVVVFFLVLGGAIAKSAQLPFFTWLYSAMEAPTSVSALLHAATMVKAGIYLLARFILIAAAAAPVMVALQPLWLPTVTWLGVLTAIIGATLALTTTDIKGVLAYSTISQLGFMMAALGSAFTGADSMGWFGSLFHMVSHAFFEGLGFLLAGGIIHAVATRDMRLMGGLRKAMPLTFALALIVVVTTSGLPPFAAFFSKSLIITSVTDAGYLIQTILLYITAAITFAYCLRFLSLVFMGKESENVVKTHPHDAPKVMLYPAAVLAALCLVWGLSEPLIAEFMHVELEVTLLSTFLSLETPIFLSLLVPAGLLVYWTYYKNGVGIRRFAASSNPLTVTLRHAYFFDDLYYGIAKGITKASDGLMHLDNLANRGLNTFAVGFVHVSDKLKKMPSNTVQNYIAAGVVGFVLILLLIILTGGGI
jgi:NADH-quinone oxidoreductase subunit L